MSYQEITKHNSPNLTLGRDCLRFFGYPRHIIGVVYHYWGDPNAGATFDGIIAWLCNSRAGASAHAVGESGRVAWLIDAEHAAWHTGHPRGNARYVGYECNPRLNGGDYETMGEFHYDMERAYNRKLEIRLHKEFVPTSCAPIDVNRIRAIADRYHAGNKPALQPQPAPTPTPRPQPEWLVNLRDYVAKLTVLPAEGVKVYNFVENRNVNDKIIPRGTQIDIVKVTNVKGKKYYLSSYAANKGLPWGIPIEQLGLIMSPSNEKPEWLKNLKDIEDKIMYTRSTTPILNVKNGDIIRKVDLNTELKVTHATTIADIELFVLEGNEEAVEPIYVNDKKVENPTEDLKKEIIKNRAILQKMLGLLQFIVKKIKNIFK